MVRGARVITILACAVGLAGMLNAQEKKKSKTASVSGKWTVSVKGSQHGDTTMGLVLEQDGKRIKGTFASPHGQHPVEGELDGRTLKFATLATDTESPQITFTATLNDDGTLAGYLSSAMGDMTWTATRVKDSQ